MHGVGYAEFVHAGTEHLPTSSPRFAVSVLSRGVSP
jgi:hypothetical protein